MTYRPPPPPPPKYTPHTHIFASSANLCDLKKRGKMQKGKLENVLLEKMCGVCVVWVTKGTNVTLAPTVAAVSLS